MLIMFLLGFASGLPLNLIGTTLTAWMKSVGVVTSTIGVFALVSMPYSLKLLWSPLLDRYRLPFLGRRRGWMTLFQLALLVMIVVLGVVGGRLTAVKPTTRSLTIIGSLAFAVGFLAASHDIVADAYRTDLLEREDRALGTSTWTLGYRIAMLTAGGVALILSDHMSWTAVYVGMASLMLIGVAATRFAPEPVVDRPPRKLVEAVVNPLVDFFKRRRAVLMIALVMVFTLGDVLARNMVLPFLLDVGFMRSEVGVVNKGFGVIATIVGTLGAGAIITRWGLWRSLVVFSLLYPLGAACYALLAFVGKSHALLLLAVGVDCLCTGFALATLDTFLMALCNRRYSATQYALLTSAAGIVGRVASSGTGFVVERIGYARFFLSTTTVVVIVIALLIGLRKEVRAADEGAPEESTPAAAT